MGGGRERESEGGRMGGRENGRVEGQKEDEKTNGYCYKLPFTLKIIILILFTVTKIGLKFP